MVYFSAPNFFFFHEEYAYFSSQFLQFRFEKNSTKKKKSQELRIATSILE